MNGAPDFDAKVQSVQPQFQGQDPVGPTHTLSLRQEASGRPRGSLSQQQPNGSKENRDRSDRWRFFAE